MSPAIVITYKKKATMVFHRPIKENYDDNSIRTAERSFYLEKYSDSVSEIVTIVLLNIYFFLGSYILLDNFTLQLCVVS